MDKEMFELPANQAISTCGGNLIEGGIAFPRQETVPNGDGNGSSCGCDRPVCRGYEGCAPGSWGLCDYPLAMVYAPCQQFRALYDAPTALNRGTLFSELDLPLGSADGGFTLTGASCCVKH